LSNLLGDKKSIIFSVQIGDKILLIQNISAVHQITQQTARSTWIIEMDLKKDKTATP
jgi:hypothetical protein